MIIYVKKPSIFKVTFFEKPLSQRLLRRFESIGLRLMVFGCSWARFQDGIQWLSGIDAGMLEFVQLSRGDSAAEPATRDPTTNSTICLSLSLFFFGATYPSQCFFVSHQSSWRLLWPVYFSFLVAKNVHTDTFICTCTFIEIFHICHCVVLSE